MHESKTKQASSPFPMSEKELQKRMESSKPLTQKQFFDRLHEINSKKDSKM